MGQKKLSPIFFIHCVCLPFCFHDIEKPTLQAMRHRRTLDAGKDNRYSQGYFMSDYDPDYTEKDTKKRHKSPKFRDYYDEEFNEEDEKELYKRRNKLGKQPKRKKDSDNEWPE